VSERRQERKVVTVLFCDLVGSTQRAEEMDPEDVASLLGPYQARVKQELERHGGTVEKFIGDAVMAVFGAPVAHEDDPERAVRAAFAIRDFATEEGIELRIGITTGEALVTLGARPDLGEAMATGDVVNTAARLQSAAAVNSILVSEKTHDATAHRIEYGEPQSIEAKGKSTPVRAWDALRARSRITLDRLHGTPLVGRERELDLLVDALARARAERQPQLVTLVGVPGIGKSRLVFELSQAADRDPELISWRQGRCLPYGEGVTFWALGEIVKAHLGILETHTAEQAESGLRAGVSEEWIQTHLRPLLGLEVDGVGGEDRREEAFFAWRRFLEGVADERPLAVVFEDLHWADENLLDFIDHLVDWASGVALLVVCTARPEFLERRPGWGGGKTNALTISLSPLSDGETSRLIAELLATVVMPADTQAALLVRAGGNPLYAEQYVRMLQERAGADLPLPETVQGIIAARLDVLEPEQKALLQNASVVGKAFWLGALTSISGIDGRAAEATLHALERRGFLRRERESSIEGDVEYAFLHALVCEVAYGQIPRAARAEKHRLAAGWIESLGRPEDDAEILAHHYGEALVLARLAGLETTMLEEPAGRALSVAGDRALALNAHAAALRFFERALELPGTGAERARLLFRRARAHFLAVDESRTDLLEEARHALLAEGDRESAAEAQMLEAMALRRSGRARDSLAAAEAAAALLQDAPATVAKGRVLANRGRLLGVMFGGEEAIEVGREALAIAIELGHGELKAMALNSIGVARVRNGDLGGIADMEESLDLALEHGSPFEIRRVRNNLGSGYDAAGQLDRAYEIQLEQLEISERFGFDLFWAKAVIADIAYASGRWEHAARCADEAIGMGESQYLGLVANVHFVRGMLRLAHDDLPGAASDFERGFELARDVEEYTEKGRAFVDSLRLVFGAHLAWAEGRMHAAEALASELYDSLRAAVDRQLGSGGEAMVDFALMLHAFGRPGDVILDAARLLPHDPWLDVAGAVARGELESAADRLGEMGALVTEAAVRLRAAAAMVAGGRRAEADAQLARALAFYRSVGATRYVREAEALLAATA
jgi:class 3 adenylate cyclase/tetratricopeptide (TPR) repeat protein